MGFNYDSYSGYSDHKRYIIKCFLAEMFGTFMLVLIGESSVAQTVLTQKDVEVTVKDPANPGVTLGTFTTKREGLNTFLQIQLGHCVGVTVGVYVSAGVSGGHINPAVTLAMATIGRLPWKKVLPYMAGQFLGGFLACPLIYAVYRRPVDEAGENAMGIWATAPHPFTTTGMAIGDQIISVFVLLVIILALTDSKNLPANGGCVPLCVGVGVFAIGLAFGSIAGFALNPARDFSPRIFEGILLGNLPFQRREQVPYYFWIPALVPFLGGILGAFAYVFVIEIHHPIRKVSCPVPPRKVSFCVTPKIIE